MKVASMMVKNANNKKHTLQVSPNDIWIGHLNHVNKNNAGIQITTHREGHNNIHTNAPRNNNSHTKEKVKVPQTEMVPLHTYCSICESINHYWALNCPDNQNQNSIYFNEIVLYQTDYDHPSKLLSLVDESRNVVVLNSGASITVCGEPWFNIFQESCYEEKHQIVFIKSGK